MNFTLRRNPPHLLELTAAKNLRSSPEGPCLPDAAAETQFMQRLHFCTAAELKPLFMIMGGFMDGHCQRAYAILRAYPQLDASHDLFFREYYEGRAVREIVELYHQRGQTITLVGHSWGGDAAVHAVAKRTMARVERLLTLDPVSRKPLPKTAPQNVGHWMNVYVDYRLVRHMQRSNFVARVGGPWEETPGAHHNVGMPGDVNHDEAVRMFAEFWKLHGTAIMDESAPVPTCTSSSSSA